MAHVIARIEVCLCANTVSGMRGVYFALLCTLPPVICLAFDIECVCAGPAGGAAASGLPNGSAAPLPSDKGLQPRQAPKLSASAQVQMEAALQKDAFLVFRALCKLSVRASETVTGTDMTAIRGKVSCP